MKTKTILKGLILFFLAVIFNLNCRSVKTNSSETAGVGFAPGTTAGESTFTITDQPEDVIIHINSPDMRLIDPSKKTRLIYFALPNGNSIEWTAGKKLKAGDDWHYAIQHIAAQTRYLRKSLPQFNIITVYLANRQKSWPAWKGKFPHYPELIQGIIHSVNNRFAYLKPAITLNSHSGGGSFLFGYLDGISAIPDNVERLAFIDSDYGYEEKYRRKLSTWLNKGRHYLNVLAYNDSVVVYNGKPLVSAHGGTWYRSKLMQKDLEQTFKFSSESDTSFIQHSALNGRIRFILKQNPNGEILHTHQVAKNGFIYSNLSGSPELKSLSFTYFGKAVYTDYILEEAERVRYPD